MSVKESKPREIVVPVQKSQILNTSYSEWHPKYSKHTPKSRTLKKLPQAFLDYLKCDGIVLPKDKYSVVSNTDDNDYSDWSEDEEPKSDIDPTDAFKSLHEDIEKVLHDFGPVTPKLNWSAPKDATWIMTNNIMKCHTASDIYLLLNSSSHIAHDLDHAFDCVTEPVVNGEDVQYDLVLRKWFNVNPALEFRVFVKNRTLIGISQRDLNYYDYLEELKPTIKSSITSFFDTVLKDSFPDADFIFDVYLPRPFDRVWLIDINVFAPLTESLLYDWSELAFWNETDEIKEMEVRLITEVNTGRFASKEHSENQVPKDVFDASVDSAAMADLAKKWQSMLANEEDSSDSEGEDETK